MILRVLRDILVRFEASRLSTKVLLLSAATTVLPLLLLTGQLQRSNTDANRRQAVEDLQGQATTQAAEIDQQFQLWRRLGAEAAGDPALARYLDASPGPSDPVLAAGAATALDRTRQLDPAFASAALLGPSGGGVAATDASVAAGLDRTQAAAFAGARSGRLTISELSVGRGAPLPMLFLAAPVNRVGGGFAGALLVRIDASRVTGFVTASRLPDDRFAMLVDQGGVVVGYTGPQPGRVLYHVLGSATAEAAGGLRRSGDYGDEQLSPLGMDELQGLLGHDRGAGRVAFPVTGRAAETGFTALKERPWTVVVIEDELAFMAPLETSTFNTVIYLVGITLLVIGVVYTAIRMLERTETQSLHDDLTALPNRRFFHDILAREMRRAQRNHRPLSVIIIDLDHFKLINDEQGHQRGDEVLRSFATVLTENVRSIDLPSRYGGEEFTVLLPDTDKEGALLVAEKLRRAAERLRLDRRASDVDRKVSTRRVTLSAGVASFPLDGDDDATVMRRADQAMYLAKSLGRNQVIGFGSAIPLSGLAGNPEKINLLVRNANRATVEALAAAIDARDSYTHGHSRRVSEYSALIGKELGLSAPDMEVLTLGALLHDVGKIGVSDAILRKVGKLSDTEFRRIKDHTNIGYEMVQGVPFLRQVAPIILHHHENMDGTGYPAGLSGDQIPMPARIVKVADAFDAMTSQRSYRQASPVEWALGELRRNMDKQFDREVVLALVTSHAKRRVGHLVPRAVAS